MEQIEWSGNHKGNDSLHRTPGAKTPYCSDFCQIRKCAMGKGMETCGDCPEMERCETLSAITGNDPQALDNLRGES